MKKKQKKKRKIMIKTIVFLILDILAIACFIMMYGPWNYVRNLFVTTAMNTMDHQWFARIFYSEEKINEIMNSNYFVTINEDANLDDIKIELLKICKKVKRQQLLDKQCQKIVNRISLFYMFLYLAV